MDRILQRGLLHIGAPAQFGLGQSAMVVGVVAAIRRDFGFDRGHGLAQALQCGFGARVAVLGQVVVHRWGLGVNAPCFRQGAREYSVDLSWFNDLISLARKTDCQLMLPPAQRLPMDRSVRRAGCPG